MLMRWVGWIFGGETLLGGIVVSNLAYLAALIYFFHLARMEGDDRLARYATLYLAIFPTAFFYLAAYAESMFLLASVAAIYHARRKEWLLAGIWGFLAPLARVQGFALAPALAYEVVRTWRETGMPRTRAVLGLALAGVGAIAFPVYALLALHKTPSGIITAHAGRFRGRFAIPGTAIFIAFGLLFRGQFLQADYFDLVFCLLFLALTVLVLRWLPSIYGVYCLLMLVLILSKASDFEALLSLSRYVLALFPAFIVLGRLGASKTWMHRLILYPSIAGLLFLTGQFVIWGWVG
jgi:Gpi18-like mannosyltransferase